MIYVVKIGIDGLYQKVRCTDQNIVEVMQNAETKGLKVLEITDFKR